MEIFLSAVKVQFFLTYDKPRKPYVCGQSTSQHALEIWGGMKMVLLIFIKNRKTEKVTEQIVGVDIPSIPWATLAISLANPVDTNLFSVSITRSDIPALYILPATSSISSLEKTIIPY
jgi:hypothetical protein